jgi:glycolate oxidase
VAKAVGCDDILDVVVPRAEVPGYLATVGQLAATHGAFMTGCGHVGDGNVHMSVFLPDDEKRGELVHAVLAAGVAVGGAISGEHGIGIAKQRYLLEMEDPVKLRLMRAIKDAFDPQGLFGPGRLLDDAGGDP